MSVSDYVRAGDNTDTCDSVYSVIKNYTTCNTTNWISSLLGSRQSWTITPVSDADGSMLFKVFSRSKLNVGDAFETGNVFPVVYLASDMICSGSGTEDAPYLV